MHFPFKQTQANFNILLEYPWTESADKGWYRMPITALKDKTHLRIMSELNSDLGYGFLNGESPTLGKTIIINPGVQRPDGRYESPANASFVHAYDQVQAGHHSKKAAAVALTMNGFMQNVYIKAGVAKELGQWSIGFNQSSFHTHKFSRNEQEAQFMSHAGELIMLRSYQADAFCYSDCTTYYGDVSKKHLKVYGSEDMQKAYDPLEDTFHQMLATTKLTDKVQASHEMKQIFGKAHDKLILAIK